MITSGTELTVQRRNTAAFIEADPETIVLTPRINVKTPSGGTTLITQTPRDPQTFKLVQRVTDAVTHSRVPGGEVIEEEYTLVGYHNASISAQDIFEMRGAQWVVLKVAWFNGYEQRAQVRRYGT